MAPWTQWHDVTTAGMDEEMAAASKQRSKAGQPAPASLNELIHEERSKLKQLPARYIPFLSALRDNIQRLVDERLGQPHHRVFRVHHQRLIREIDQRIDDLRSNRDLAEFEENIQPYILAHAALIDGAGEGAAQGDASAAANSFAPLGVAPTSLHTTLQGMGTTPETAHLQQHRFVHSELAVHHPAAAAAAPMLAPQQLATMTPVQQRLYQRVLGLVSLGGAGMRAEGSAPAPAAARSHFPQSLRPNYFGPIHTERGSTTTAGTPFDPERHLGAAAASSFAAIGGAPHSAAASVNDLARHMFSRLWGEHHTPSSSVTTAQDLCERCGSPMIKSIRDMMLVCSRCGSGMAYLDSTEATRTYGDDVEFILGSSSRYNHWQEFITRAQAREITAVPLSVLSKVARALRSVFQVGTAAEVTLDKVVAVVRELNLRDYKKNACQICARLSGVWPVQLTAEQLFIAKGMFFEILNAFEQLYPGEKKFFRQRYVTLVICVTMGWDDMVRTLEMMEGGPGNSSSSGAAHALRDEAAPAAAAPAIATGFAPAGSLASSTNGWSSFAALAGSTFSRSNVPVSFQRAARSEIEESELRMRAIFRHLGWVYRGPYCGILAPDADLPATGIPSLRAEQTQHAPLLRNTLRETPSLRETASLRETPSLRETASLRETPSLRETASLRATSIAFAPAPAPRK